MAITRASFLGRFPEFTSAPTDPEDLIQLTLDAHLPKASFANPTDFDELHLLRTADFLSFSPFARDLKLVNDDGKSVYAGPLKTLVARLTFHRRYTP